MYYRGVSCDGLVRKPPEIATVSLEVVCFGKHHLSAGSRVTFEGTLRLSRPWDSFSVMVACLWYDTSKDGRERYTRCIFAALVSE